MAAFTTVTLTTPPTRKGSTDVQTQVQICLQGQSYFFQRQSLMFQFLKFHFFYQEVRYFNQMWWEVVDIIIKA